MARAQAGKAELSPDREHQEDDPEFREGPDFLGPGEYLETVRPEGDADDEVRKQRYPMRTAGQEDRALVAKVKAAELPGILMSCISVVSDQSRTAPAR